jgi:DNA-binding response OmpR family regulator
MRLSVVRSETSSGRKEAGPSPWPTCLIVEDQALIGLSLEAYLEEVGFRHCKTFPSGAAALAWLSTHTPTVAVLDFSLKDGPCTKLVRVLRERGIPFVIYSGHPREIAPPVFRNVPWLSKPCDRATLLAALARAAPALAEATTPAVV